MDIFFQASYVCGRLLFEQASADGGGLLALMEIDPLANLATSAGGLDEGKPVARGRVTLLRDDFNHVAI